MMYKTIIQKLLDLSRRGHWRDVILAALLAKSWKGPLVCVILAFVEGDVVIL